ncbi:SusC/RagA family TonB-linked outer membrane protein [Pedobacter hiemivivus]|nr:SusC/RagA family TonB-linked outer membrane protein [Pedobacter hiemivivus]
MKITGILVFIAIMQVNASSFAQRITLSQKNITLDEFFREVKKQTGYNISYSDKVIYDAKKVNVDFKAIPLDQAITTVLDNRYLAFEISGKDITILPSKSVFLDQIARNLKNMNVSGKVYNFQGEMLVGATISLKNGKKSTMTNQYGDFTLNDVDENGTLVISYLGYTTKEIQIKSKAYVGDIMLELSDSKLDEVQVIAYGKTTQRYNIGSVATVTAKDIQQQPVTNVLLALQGRVPGLVVTNSNGAPGAMVTTQIRGQNSLANSQNSNMSLATFNQPLYIIDGVPMSTQNNRVITPPGLASSSAASYWRNYTGLSPLNSINPNDIESISVLKDADATSIYGSQGSNGVILITTKRGQSGKTHFNVALNSGPTAATRTPQMMNTQQYIEMRQEALRNSGLTANPALDADVLLFDQTKYKNWMDEFYGGVGHHTDFHSSLSGGTSNTNYLVSGGYTHESYNFPGDFADNRLSLHSSFNHKTADNRFTLDFGTDYSYDANNSTGAPDLLSAFTLPPNYPDMVDASGNLVWSYKGVPLSNTQGYLKQISDAKIYNLNSHLMATYEIITGLRLGVSAGYSRQNVEGYSATPIISQNPASGMLGSALFNTNYSETLNLEPQLTFVKQLSKGVLNVVAGGTYRKNKLSNLDVSAFNYSNDALLGSIGSAGASYATNSSSIYKYIAAFGRINYVWDNKYIVNLTGNRNGSSNFGPDRRFGNFGSAGAGWIFSNESFAKALSPVLSFGKLSANYGTSGTDGVQPYMYQPNWGPSNVYGGYQGIPGYAPINPLNPIYAWATNKKLNFQLDLGFLQDRLVFSATSYKNKTDNQLVSYLQPIQTGFSSITANAPYTVENKGLEFSLTSKNFSRKDFQWATAFNISFNKNKLTKFDDLNNSPYADIYVVGQPVNIFMLIPYEGVDPNTGIFQYRKADGTLTNTPYNATGVNGRPGDRTVLMDLNPKFTGGLNNQFSYKGISLTLFFQFAKQKGESYLYSIYNNGGQIPGKPNTNLPVQFLDRWQKVGDNASIQRLISSEGNAIDRKTAVAARAFSYSTGAYTDASYIRLKTVSLSYNIPASMAKKVFLGSANIFVNAQNLLTITGYKVGDPETQNLYSIPAQRTIVAGVNLNF